MPLLYTMPAARSIEAEDGGTKHSHFGFGPLSFVCLFCVFLPFFFFFLEGFVVWAL